MTKRAEYYLFKKQKTNGELIWYAKYVDANTGKIFTARSTGVLAKGKGESKNKAHEAAMGILPTVQRGKQKIGTRKLTDYVQDFWSEGSAYVRTKKDVKKRPLSATYILNNRNAIKNHIVPSPMKEITLKNVTYEVINGWQLWAVEKGMSGRQVNAIIKAIRVAVRYAIKQEKLEIDDPFKEIEKADETPREKGVLTAEELQQLLKIETADPREKLTVLLGIQCGGMRRGEIRGLQWGDIDTEKKIIHIIHNYQDLEGVKTPKAGSTRNVPLPDAVENALEAVRGIHINPTDTAYVFESVNTPGRPHCPEYFVNALRHCLEKIGITANEQKCRNITLHSLRHSFVTLGRQRGLNDFEIQTLAGHKSSAMMDRYSHGKDTLDMDKIRKIIEKPVNIMV